MSAADTLAELSNHLKGQSAEVTGFRGEAALHVDLSSLLEALSYLKRRGYAVLMDLTGVDYLQPSKRTKLIYILHNPDTYERVRVTAFALREESAPSVTELWAGADWYEREIYDLFGVPFANHPDLKRILMPDDWQGHPLRRDYALTEEPVEFKHGVKPKVPSEIIHPSQSARNISQLGTSHG